MFDGKKNGEIHGYAARGLRFVSKNEPGRDIAFIRALSKVDGEIYQEWSTRLRRETFR